MHQINMYLLMARKYPGKGKGYYGYRLEMITDSGKLHEKEVFDEEENITQNQLALVMMYRAFEELKKPCEVTVFTDSMYLRRNYVQNLGNWTLNSWLNGKGEPVANGELWKKLDEITAPHAVRFSTDYQWPGRAEMTKKLMERKMGNVG